MLFTFLDTAVSSVRIHRIFFAVQQLSALCDIGHIGGGTRDVMNQARFDISANMRLHPEEIQVTFLGLMHPGGAFYLFVPGRTRGMNIGTSTMVPLRSDRPFSCK